MYIRALGYTTPSYPPHVTWFGLAVLGKRFFGSWDVSDALKPDKNEP
ncbi:hypothetical protein HMPREF0183_0754 [Brevibacterium mcbrellneri ATCC 49030]|uniref:Uncharacterized protein n=1 Tax=Brevibacterium mcbrellneri ATCC 49030 TaxID=585530 RepID=D4YLE4_9MICO|nr:hypothetical protein HMPREF0183_0754 [Brevibacterium mcbrellneri ATCC 49030]